MLELPLCYNNCPGTADLHGPYRIDMVIQLLTFLSKYCFELTLHFRGIGTVLGPAVGIVISMILLRFNFDRLGALLQLVVQPGDGCVPPSIPSLLFWVDC